MRSQGELFSSSGAIVSACQRYRFKLFRRWEARLGEVNFIMLNPSTADANEDDPTIRRCVHFAASWGYGGIVVTNLFAWRATDPAELEVAPDPVGKNNDAVIWKAAFHAQLVVCAWGSRGYLFGRASGIVDSLIGSGIPLNCLALNADGMPTHPLYQPSHVVPAPFLPSTNAGTRHG